MAFVVDSFPEYSHTLHWQTTQKSMSIIITVQSWSLEQYRVLIATIRDMGIAPCPRCTVKKEDIHTLGTTSDIESRLTKLRHDDDNFRAVVEKARNNIYRNGFALHSEPGVECLLKDKSLVPTLVSSSVFRLVYDIYFISRTLYRTV